MTLFEFEPMDADRSLTADAHLFDVRIRYKDPGESESKLLDFPVSGERLLSKNTSDFGFVSAVAMFGEYLRDGGGSRSQLRAMISGAEDNLGRDKDGYREDFIDLLYDLRSI